MEKYYYTRSQVASMLRQIGTPYLVERYEKNTLREIVVSEKPVMSSFNWANSPEGGDFWILVDSSLNNAINSKSIVVPKPITRAEAEKIVEDSKRSPEKFLRKNFIHHDDVGKDSGGAILKTLLEAMGIKGGTISVTEVTKEELDDEEDEEEDEDNIEEEDEGIKDAEKFAEDMMKVVKMHRNLQKTGGKGLN